MSETQEFRVERDSLGEMRIPAGAYWGVNTARALENFSISRRQISVYPDFIVAYAGGRAEHGDVDDQ